MAVGKSAEPMHNLLDELGGPEQSSNFVLQELIKFLSGEKIREFVDYFRLNHDMHETIVHTHFDYTLELDDSTEDFESSENCHKEETNPTAGSSRFFSSQIPEC